MDDRRVILASGNAHKAGEFAALVKAAGLGWRLESARTFGGMPEVVEDTGTFVGNARKKAMALRALAPAEAWVLADDSGVCVDELGGGPGVESAYFAGPVSDAAANLRKLVEVMRAVPTERRGAQFVCILVMVAPDGGEVVATGECRGRLAVEPRGAAGFGYDPLFMPDGYESSFAELGEAVKRELSHRGRAWAELVRLVAG